MSGVLCVIAGGRTALSYSGTVTVGTSTFSGKGVGVTQNGYGDSTLAVAGSTFGSRSPTTVNGFSIIGIYWEQTNVSSPPSTVNQSFLVVVGDSSAYAASLSVDGVDQGLGAGSFGGGNTTYSSTGMSNPFPGVGNTVAVAIS